MMVYLSDVDEGTHCISFSPEDATEPLHKSNDEQLGARGEYHLHGPKGTVRAKPGSLSALRLHSLVAILPLTALRTLRADWTLQLGHPAHRDHAANRLHAQVRPDLLRPPRQALPRERLRHPADFLEGPPGPGDAPVLRQPERADADVHARLPGAAAAVSNAGRWCLLRLGGELVRCCCTYV